MKRGDLVGIVLAIGLVAGFAWAGRRIVREVSGPIPGVVRAFEVSSGARERVQWHRPTAEFPVVEHPDSDSVTWLHTPYWPELPRTDTLLDQSEMPPSVHGHP